MIPLNLRLAASVLIPLAAAVLLIAAGNRLRPVVRSAAAMLAAAADMILIVPVVLTHTRDDAAELLYWQFPGGTGAGFRADAAALVFVCAAIAQCFICACVSAGIGQRTAEQSRWDAPALAVLSLSFLAGFGFSSDLLTFSFFCLLLMAVGCLLLMIHRDPGNRKRDRRYPVYALIAALLLIAAIIWTSRISDTFEFTPGGFLTPDKLSAPYTLILFLMLTVPCLVNACVMPMHGWLPRAAAAEEPCSLQVLTVSIGMTGTFGVFRVVLYVFGPSTALLCHGSDVLMWTAAFTIVAGSLVANQREVLMERIAYVSIAQLSCIAAGVAALSSFAASGALYLIAVYALSGTMLVLSAGAVVRETGKEKVYELMGAGKHIPVTLTAFTMASLAVAGVPLTACFTGKAGILLGMISMGKSWQIAVILLGSLLTVTGLIRVVLTAANRGIENPVLSSCREAGHWVLIPLFITALVIVVLGMAPNCGLSLYDLASEAGNSVFDTIGVGL